MTLLTLGVSVLSALVQIRINKERMVCSAKERGLVYSLITGIQKIRLSGAENRAFSKWSVLFSKVAELQYNPPLLIRMSKVITSFITLSGISVPSGGLVAADYDLNGYLSIKDGNGNTLLPKRTAAA